MIVSIKDRIIFEYFNAKISFEPLSLPDKSRGVTHGEALLKQKIYQKHAEQAIALFTRWSRLGVKVFKRKSL